jgi:hypothetical protein
MFQTLLLTVFLAAPTGAHVPADALRRELDGVAHRIAELKARAMDGADVGSELEPLLVRSQELAEALERSRPRPAAAPCPSPTALDLRARADALYLEADGVAADLAEVEERIRDALEAGAGQPGLVPAPGALSNAAIQLPREAPRASPVSARRPLPAIVPLLEERAGLKRRIRALLLEAAELDGAADRLER